MLETIRKLAREIGQAEKELPIARAHMVAQVQKLLPIAWSVELGNRSQELEDALRRVRAAIAKVEVDHG